ncbi:MAG TPA: hypothetical protein PK402_08195 [Tepidisphaeraceae bacterium]|nr:hypothetical protein [Tepidisphaeraceae bacterium]
MKSETRSADLVLVLAEATGPFMPFHLVVARLRREDAVEPLLSLIDHPGVLQRCVAAEALGDIGDQRAGVELTRLLDDPDYSVRIFAIVGVGRIANPNTYDALISRYKRAAKEDWHFRNALEQSLARFNIPFDRHLDQ